MTPARARVRSWLAIAAVLVLTSPACTTKRSGATTDADASSASSEGGAFPAASGSSAPPRAGMAFVPEGELKAGTPKDKTPRIADEEMPGTAVPMRGFYMDLYAYPNEAGAIPSTNVTRDEAAHLCEAKGKRLCTELEWERACKGPDNTTYSYGDQYRATACGTGATAEISAKRPAGDKGTTCKSAFGVLDLHGGVWEWTASEWGRGSSDGHDGALRGGNALAGEVVDRCANGLARPLTTKSATIGFRCCAGEKNAAEVSLAIAPGPTVESMKIDPLAEAFGDLPPRAWDVEKLVEYKYINALTWRPIGNEALTILVGCTKGLPKKCGVFVGSRETGKAQKLAAQGFGAAAPEIIQTGDKKVLRARAVDYRGLFSRDIFYSYGRVEFGPEKRP